MIFRGSTYFKSIPRNQEMVIVKDSGKDTRIQALVILTGTCFKDKLQVPGFNYN